MAYHGEKRKRSRRGRHLPPPQGTVGQEVEGWFLTPDEGPLRSEGGRFYASGLEVASPRPYRRLVRRIGLGVIVVRDRLRRYRSSH